jgi:hypothetical protein
MIYRNGIKQPVLDAQVYSSVLENTGRGHQPVGSEERRARDVAA